MTKININRSSFIDFTDMAGRSAVVSACSLGLSASLPATGVSGFLAEMPAFGLGGLPVPARNERNERPTKALEAGVAAEAKTYAFAAASAESLKQTKQHHAKWAFRGLEPWSDPA
ncbi:hypothetical protein [Streptomyces sp. CAU 1734]|uniref:hypothetical protein n=1 Tax=Streptomyces sp. CAU 1734 TaxID=3140360 RepID=UPI0032607852